jgi:soluble lytic murein transglycosylase-like protein
MAGKAWMIPVVAIGAGLVAMISTSAARAESSAWLPTKKGKKMGKTLKDAAANFPKEVVASATKWAKKRGLLVADVLATILLESRGDPKAHALSAKEDSRGAMQVNVRAWHPTIIKLGYTDDDLYKLDVGIEVGTYVLKSYRDKVTALVKACPAPQYHDLSTLTRLYYAGPKYVESMLKKAKTKEETAHPFKDAETYVSHWHDAINAIAEVYGNAAYA